MNPYEFCTYFDSKYLAEGLALVESLERQCLVFRLWVLCLDDDCLAFLKELQHPKLELISLGDFERGDEALALAKSNRSRVEYIFTCTASLPLYIFRHDPAAEIVTYLDADLYFFADPRPLFDELGENSVAIIGHRFPPNLKRLEIAGIYNVGWLTFRNDARGIACLQWWRERCLEWCKTTYEDGKYGDQGYLNDWPQRFEGVVELQHKGANLAPWNLANYTLTAREGKVFVDEQALLFYHFQGLKYAGNCLWDLFLSEYEVRPTPLLIKYLYSPYLNTLLKGARKVTARLGSKQSISRRVAEPVEATLPLWRRYARRSYQFVQKMRNREFLLVIRNRVWP